MPDNKNNHVAAEAPAEIRISNWKEVPPSQFTHTLSLTLPDGSTVHGCTLHTSGSLRYLSLTPSHISDYSLTVQFNSDQTRKEFHARALAAIDAFLQKQKPAFSATKGGSDE